MMSGTNARTAAPTHHCRRAKRSNFAFSSGSPLTRVTGQSALTFHHRFRTAVADDFYALAFVNQLTLRNHVEDFIAELGLPPGPQRRKGDAHLPKAREVS